MGMVSATQAISWAPFGLYIDWPFGYVAGQYKDGSNNYNCRIAKYDLHQFPWEVVAIQDYFTNATSAWFGSCEGGVAGQSDYLWCCGCEYESGAYYGVVSKVRKSDLGIEWTYKKTPSYGYYHARNDAEETYVFACGNDTTSHGLGTAIHLDDGGEQWHLNILGNATGSVMGFYGTSVDFNACAGGIRSIQRKSKAAGAIVSAMGSNYYFYRQPVEIDIGGTIYYYVPGSYYPEYTLSFAKFQKSNGAQSWEKYKTKVSGYVFEGLMSAVTDNNNIWCVGYYCGNTGTAPYLTPYTTVFEKYDLDGNNSVEVVHGTSELYPPFEHCIAPHQESSGYFFDVLFKRGSSPYSGVLEQRNFSNGQIASVSDTRIGRWFPYHRQV